MASERLEVQRVIAAEPAAIFRILRDPQGHVAIDSSGMLMDATGEPVTAVGDRFVVHMDRESLNDYPMGRYDVTVTITTFVPDREIAWTILGQVRPQIGHVYGYALAPVGEGTLVTSYYDWSAIDPAWKQAGVFPVLSEGALRATLGILARTVARDGIGGQPTDEATVRTALERHWEYSGRDEDVAHEIYHDDAVLEFPQSGERFEGVENFREWRRAYPASLAFEIRRIRGRGDLWVAENSISYDGGPWNLTVSILELRGDKVARESVYITEGWSAPDWRAPWRSAPPAPA